MDRTPRPESPGTKALRMRKKILSQRPWRKKTRNMNMSENIDSLQACYVPHLATTPADKPLKDMTAIEYYWFHKKQYDALNKGVTTTRSVRSGSEDNPTSKRSRSNRDEVHTPEKIRRAHGQKK